MNTYVKKIRNVWPSLVLGVCITLLATLFNYVVYNRRLPAMAAGNPILVGGDDQARGRFRTENQGENAFLRALAGLVNLSDDYATDLMFAIRGPVGSSTRDRITVVAIDEDSIIRMGAWPWPRDTIARLLEKASSARVVGLDLLFPDPDRTSLYDKMERFAALTGADPSGLAPDMEMVDNDRYFAQTVSRARTVLGTIVYNGIPPNHRPDGTGNSGTVEVRFPDGREGPSEEVLLRQSGWALTNLPLIRQSEPPPLGEGFLNIFPAPNGSVRTVPLFTHVADVAFSQPSHLSRRVAPSFALEVFRVYEGCDGYRINLRGDQVVIPEFVDPLSDGSRFPVESVSLLRDAREALRIPLSELAEMEVGLGNHQGDYTVYPAWQVLEGRFDHAFGDKIVLIGSTLPGIGMVISGGSGNQKAPTVEVHAAMLSGMLKGDFVDAGYTDDYSWQQLAILASGLAVTAAIILWDLFGGMIASALAILVIVFGNYFLFFRQGVDVGMTLPLISVLAVLAVLMVSNYLVVGRERRFIRRAFQLNVSPAILGYLESNPDWLSSLQGEHRHMSVLFSDIRAFTTLSERMTAPDLARFLNEYFTPMSDIVMDHGGTVDKFIGDGMMAFWNAPADNPHHARDAARSALDMLVRLNELQQGWSARGLPPVTIGCGINTGLMFAGYMGSEQRKNYTVMGDNVNIASRLENLNKIYATSILISESTRAELEDDFVYRVVDKVRVSGKMEAVLIYELLGTGPASEEQSEELAAFSRVFELYQEREFATAETLLKELVFIRPAPLYKLYLDRLAIYKALPPPPDWDGTFTMTHK